MKKFLFIFILLITILNVFSQNHPSIVDVKPVKQTVNNTDNYSFYLTYPNYEECRKKLMIAWGRPLLHEPGSIKWDKLSFPNVGNNLIVLLSDGIFSTEGNSESFVPFVNDIEKTQLLNKSSDQKFRQIRLTFKDDQGNNVINSEALAGIVTTMIQEILLESSY